MTSEKTIARIESLIWILVYAGLFGIILGIASLSSSRAAAWSLIVLGVVLTVAGAILVYVRSRLNEPH